VPERKHLRHHDIGQRPDLDPTGRLAAGELDFTLLECGGSPVSVKAAGDDFQLAAALGLRVV
jgi:hypothetical protein